MDSSTKQDQMTHHLSEAAWVIRHVTRERDEALDEIERLRVEVQLAAEKLSQYELIEKWEGR